MTAVMEPETEIAERPVVELLGNGVESGSVVEVSGDAGPTQGWLVVEDGSPTGERRCAVVPLDGAGSVLSGSLWEVKVKPSAAAGVMPQWVSAVAAGWWACRVAIKERDTAQRELRIHGERLERIVDAAHEYADDNDLCSRFDDFMREQGLRARVREYRVEVEARVRVTVRVSASSADAASDDVDDALIADALSELSSRELYGAINRHEVMGVDDD